MIGMAKMCRDLMWLHKFLFCGTYFLLAPFTLDVILRASMWKNWAGLGNLEEGNNQRRVCISPVDGKSGLQEVVWLTCLFVFNQRIRSFGENMCPSTISYVPLHCTVLAAVGDG